VRTFTDLSLEEVETIERLIGQGEVAPRSDDERKEMHDLLFTLLDRLPEKQRTAVILRDLEEIPYDKMAQTLGWTEQAARLKVFRGRARLKELMERALRRKAASRR
jgi:RNA polymerase sigma-70 factor (ECF subfamily)